MSDPAPPPGFAIQQAAHDDGTVRLSISGELDMISAAVLEQRLDAVLAQDDVSGIVLDLGGLSFIDSTGLRVIVISTRACTDRGRVLTLIPGPPAVQRVFELTGLLDALPFTAHEPDAPRP
jgi:anti-sigma B factor antagonist